MMQAAISAATFGRDQPVELALSSSAIAEAVCGTANLLVVNDGLAVVASVVSRSPINRFASRDGTIREGTLALHRLSTPEILDRHGIEIASVETRSSAVLAAFDYGAFIKAAISRQILALEGFLKALVIHCANRSVGDKKLSAVTSIQLRLAEVSQGLALIREMVRRTERPTAAIHCEIASMISRSADLLVKTAGARSMLVGGLIEMQFIFTLFNSIYLRGASEQH